MFLLSLFQIQVSWAGKGRRRVLVFLQLYCVMRCGWNSLLYGLSLCCWILLVIILFFITQGLLLLLTSRSLHAFFLPPPIRLISCHPGETGLLYLPTWPSPPHLIDSSTYFTCAASFACSACPGLPLLTVRFVLHLPAQPGLPYLIVPVNLLLVCPSLVHLLNPACLLALIQGLPLTLPASAHLGTHTGLAHLLAYLELCLLQGGWRYSFLWDDLIHTVTLLGSLLQGISWVTIGHLLSLLPSRYDPQAHVHLFCWPCGAAQEVM